MNAWNGMRPVHAGEILRGEIDELGLSVNALSMALGVPVNRVTMILERPARRERRHTALRLAWYFGTTPQLWLNLPKTWEFRQAKIATGREIAKRVTPQPSTEKGAVADARS
ncbi:MAG: HigA family addiction module antitoxin [Roseovarius sp.]|nr:HigA family addiction module antitoxin [Roseovarius sp.]